MQPQFFQYYNRVQTVRGSFGTLPPWARSIVLIFALPGIVLASLSLILFLISISVLLLLTVPVYRAMQAVAGRAGSDDRLISVPDGDASPGAKPVQVRIVE